jgi:hypothetical protein
MPVPSATNIKFKFPAFINVDDATIEFAIEEAVIACGDPAIAPGGWIDEANQTLAIMYYAAHLMQVAIMFSESATGQRVSSERTPELSVTYAVPVKASYDDITMTIYGERFLRLVESNFPAVLTVGSAVSM